MKTGAPEASAEFVHGLKEFMVGPTVEQVHFIRT